MGRREKKLHGLIVKSGTPPYEAGIKNASETFVKICGGAIESSVMPQMCGSFYCNATGKQDHLPLNRLLVYGNGWKDIICGTFIVFGGLGNSGMESLTLVQMDLYKKTAFHTRALRNKGTDSLFAGTTVKKKGRCYNGFFTGADWL